MYLNEYFPELASEIVTNDDSESNIQSMLFESTKSVTLLIPKKKRPIVDGKMAYVVGTTPVELTCEAGFLTDYTVRSWVGSNVTVTKGTNSIIITGKTAGNNYVHSIVLTKTESIGSERVILSKVYDLRDGVSGKLFTGTISSGYQVSSTTIETTVTCPPDYIQLERLKANGWMYPVFKTLSIDSPEYIFEGSKYTAKKVEDPKVFEELGTEVKLVH
ncbi:MAG: hypothetical protein RI909_1284, partial [Bacteroidota bacterium]